MNANTIAAMQRFYKRRTSALIRLVCYGWMLVVLTILSAYAPHLRWLIHPGIHTMILFVGFNVGKFHRIYIPSTRKGEKK